MRVQSRAGTIQEWSWASSASSERLFSAAGNAVAPLRTNLDDEHVSQIVYLNKNVAFLS